MEEKPYDIKYSEVLLQQWGEENMSSNEGKQSYKCDMCESTLTTASNLKTHKLNLHGVVKQYKCSTCGYLAFTESRLKKHSNVHSEEYPYRCNVCDYASKWSSNLRKHKLRHSKLKRKGRSKVKCDKCESSFSTATTLKSHQQKVHGGVVNVFKCSKCGYVAFTESRLKKHLKNHAEDFTYKCNICEYSSRHSGHILRHQIAHIKVKAHKCEECESTFSAASTLKWHKLTVHEGGRTFDCPYCGFIPFKESKLKNHLLVHTEENPTIFVFDYAY